MAYISEWKRLSDALARVRAATGLSQDEVRTDICRAVTDRAIGIRGQLKRNSRGVTSKAVLEGKDFNISKIQPEDLDWEKSRPLKPWEVRRGAFDPPGYWELELIELFGPDVTKVLCPANRRAESAQLPSIKKSKKGRSRPASERVEGLIKELYPRGVPDQASEPNKILCKHVLDKIEEKKLPRVSDDTILRAAGRRK